MKVRVTLLEGLFLVVCALLSANLLTAQTAEWQQGRQDSHFGVNFTGDDLLATNNAYEASLREFPSSGTDEDGGLPAGTTQKAKLPDCESTVTFDGYSYPVVRVGYDCWFRENLKATTGIDGAVAYMQNPANKDKFGLLYSWQAAVAANASNNQGVCPDGWAIPTVEDLQNLYANANKDIGRLKDSDPSSWISGKCGKDPSTGFDLLGAGYFESEQNCFEDLLSNTLLWTAEEGASSGTAICCEFNYYSSEPMFKEVSVFDKVSVRCIKKN